MFKTGQRVKVVIPPLDNGIARGMHKYNGKTSTIIGTVHYSGYGKDSYLLDGFVSPCGLNYEWVDEWLAATESEG